MQTNGATLSRDDLIERAYPLVAIEARRFGSLPPGVSTEDLESLGGEVLLSAAAEYDGPHEGWRRWAKSYLRNRMRAFVRQARVRARRSSPLEVELPDGDSMPIPELAQAGSDPATIAEGRELLRRRKRPMVSATRLERSLPSPAEVADRVTELRAAMFEAIEPAKIREMMGAIQAQAAEGDLKSARLLIDLLSPARSGVTVNQQAVVIRTGDLD